MAAGKSTRMKSALPKAAHPICGKPMARHIIDACRQAGVRDVVVVVGHEAETVVSTLGDDVRYAHQSEQLGTGHACREAMPAITEDVDSVIVLPGDTPLVTPDLLKRLISTHYNRNNAATLVTAVLEDAAHYGRIVRDADGAVMRVQEAKDAPPEVLALGEINTSIYCFARRLLAQSLESLKDDNAQGEYYLTDVVGILSDRGHRVGALVADDPADVLGINNRVELAEAGAVMRRRILAELMLSGVTIMDPQTTWIDCDVQIAPDTVVHPCTVIGRGSRIGFGANKTRSSGNG